MKRPIVIWPNPVLVKNNESILFTTEENKKALHTLLEDLRDTLWTSGGVGIAAPQIGVNKRVLLVLSGTHEKNPGIIEMINPELLEKSKEKFSLVEGCLSFPGEEVLVERPKNIVIRYYDRDGASKLLDTKERPDDRMLPVEIQHEFDHLLGITLADYVGYMRRDVMRRRLSKLNAEQPHLSAPFLGEATTQQV